MRDSWVHGRRVSCMRNVRNALMKRDLDLVRFVGIYVENASDKVT